MYEIRNIQDEEHKFCAIESAWFQIHVRQDGENLPTIEWTTSEVSAQRAARFHTALALAIRIAEEWQEETA